MVTEQELIHEIKNAPSATIDTNLIDLDPNNPNKMSADQLNALELVMAKYGFAVELWVNKKPNGRYKIIDGEQRFRILLRNKIKKVQCRVFEISEAEAAMLQQIANKLKGTHVPAKDALQYQKIFGAGKLEEFSKYMAENIEHFQAILNDRFNIEFAKPEGEVPDLPKEPKSKLGDIYQLGNHKLICGDSTDPKVINLLFGTNKASQIVTDPPYGVDYSSKNEFLNKMDNGKRIESPMKNDNLPNYKQLYTDFLKLAPLQATNTIYIFMGSNNLHILRQAIEDAGCSWSQYLIWLKNNHVYGRTDYLAKHEFISYGWKSKHKFYGPTKSTILEYDKPNKSKTHPTMKPLDLVTRLVQDGSKQKSIIYDPFVGSGTTIIACEQTNRTCYAIELEPKYVDVSIQRWEKYTGKEAKLL